jgi:hypothetical protein
LHVIASDSTFLSTALLQPVGAMRHAQGKFLSIQFFNFILSLNLQLVWIPMLDEYEKFHERCEKILF